MSLDPFRPEAFDPDRAQQLRLMNQQTLERGRREGFEEGRKVGELTWMQRLIEEPLNDHTN